MSAVVLDPPCAWCFERPIKSRGRCERCYAKWWRRSNPDRVAAYLPKQRAARRRWRQRYPERQAAAQRKGRAQARERLQAIKLERGCLDCGYRSHPEALQFDHVRGPKLFELASGSRRAWPLIEAEMNKCEVVCANCHAIRSASRRESEESNERPDRS